MTVSRSVLSVAIAALLSASINVSASGLTKIFYSGYFFGHVPTQSLEGATVFAPSVTGLGIKFSATKYVTGTIITHEIDNLSADFNLADYPLYFLGLKDTGDLPPEVAEPFQRSLQELKSSMDDPAIETVKIDGATVYTACSVHCEAFVVQESQAEQILHLTSRGFGQSELISIVKGEHDAAK